MTFCMPIEYQSDSPDLARQIPCRRIGKGAFDIHSDHLQSGYLIVTVFELYPFGARDFPFYQDTPQQRQRTLPGILIFDLIELHFKWHEVLVNTLPKKAAQERPFS